MNIALRRRVFSSRVALVAALAVLAATGEFVSGQSTRPKTRTVKAFVQPRPGMTAWARDSAGVLLPAILSYQSGWMEFNPDATVFRAPTPP
ncbi:MAG: hypothetical protein IID28_10210 [Planctomycetes bacterium]|nr:hypothetical protein [Planctomycetota bacterium]